MSEQVYAATAKSQLERLATLTDVVYAVALVLIISWLPLPEESHSTGAVWILDLWSEYSNNIIAVALIGIAAGAAWWWARRKGLVRPGISKDEMLGVQIEAFAEPLAALVTLPSAFVRELAWNLSWLAYIPISRLLRRREEAVRDELETMRGQLEVNSIRRPMPWMAAVLVIVVCMSFSPVAAQEQEQSHFALPFEFEGDYGAPNGNALLLRFMPLWRVPVKENWSLLHLDLITLADAPPLAGNPINPEPVPGEKATGLSDLIHVTLYTPKSTGKLIWGVGGIVSVPTATDDALGSGKWAAGVAARIGYKGEFWNIGAIAGQRWSFAGDSDRAEINALLIRGSIRRGLGSGWFFVSAPIINANWNSSSGNRWLVPVGGGFGKTFGIGRATWAASVQAYANVIKPNGAPDWSLRLAFVAPVPTQWFRNDD